MESEASQDTVATGDGLRLPVPRDVGELLRRAALDHAVTERRRVHLPLLHVGVPGGRERVFAIHPGEVGDHALRADVVAAMVRATRSPARPPLVWLTRTGDLALQDVDADWLAAALTAYAEAGLPLLMVVVNRHGWRDPRTGARRDWARLRRR